MRRSLVYTSRRCQRALGTQAATASEVPDDPDILTTQDPDLNQQRGGSSSLDPQTGAVNLSQKYPRLQYRSPSLGVNPAFDLALDLIKQNKQLTKQKLGLTKQKINKISAKTDSTLKESQLRELQLYKRQLEGLVDINDPEIHWRHARGDVDLSMPIYRHLAERTWSEKQLLLLMQRVTQMSVTPDVIPIISPTIDVRLKFPSRTRGQRKGLFEVGEMMETTDSELMPEIEIQSFGDGERKFSLAIVDPDVPDESKDSYTSYLHYLQTDITLLPTQHAVEASNGQVVHSYIPPHPHKGTPYHRYTVIVWEQPTTPPQPNAPLAGKHDIARSAFDAQHYAVQNGLHAVGINFWRQVWDAKVSPMMARLHPELKYVERNYRRIKA